MQDAKSFASFVKEEPNIYSDLEIELIKKFPPARNVGYSSLLLNMGGISSFHRLLLDPLRNALFSSRGEDFTYRENVLQREHPFSRLLWKWLKKPNRH